MPRQRTTIRELARKSGVSVGTVSRALNGYPDVSPETRERVFRLARELDYTPAAAARTLVTQRSHVVGVILETGEGHPDLQHPFFHEVLGGLKSGLGAAGFDLMLFASERPGNGFGPHSYLKRCQHHNVDGVVLMGGDADDEEVRRLARSGLPCVGVDLELTGPRAGCVMSDNVAGAQLAVRHLAELGHRRIATIAGRLDTRPARDRLAGYRREIEAQELAYRDEYVVYGDYYAESGRAAMRRLLEAAEPPTAVFAASDMMAIGAMLALHEAGVEVPGGVAVVGFDDITIAEHSQPPLTTLRQNKFELGKDAAAALMRRIEGEDAPEIVTRTVDLVVRASTQPGGGRHPVATQPEDGPRTVF
jgi:LacI family transcriptional regulator